MAGKGGKGVSLATRIEKIHIRTAGKTPAKSGKKVALKGEASGSSSKSGKFSVGSPSSEASPRWKTTPSAAKGGKVPLVSPVTEAFPAASDKGKGSFSSGKGGKVPLASPIFEGVSGKGGKDDKTGKASGKTGTSQVPKKVVINQEEIPKNAKCLMDCEAASTLQRIHEELQMLSDDPAVKIPKSFEKGLQFAKSGSHYSNHESARQILETLKRKKISDAEICMIGNMFPETVDEVYCLVPSIKAKKQVNEGSIEKMLSDLASLRKVK